MPRERKMPQGMWKRGATYYARFRAGGRLVRKRLSTDYTAACELLNELRARADKADFGLLDNDYPWGDLKRDFLKWARQSLRPRVTEEYERDLKCFDSFISIRSVQQIQPHLIFGFREHRRQDVSARTVNRQVGTINNVLNKGVQWNRIASNPIAGVKPLRHEQLAKERRSMTPDEVKALFDFSPEYLKPVWRMLICTGIRKAELIAMRFNDIDFDQRLVTVRAVTAKTGRAREIPLDDTMLEMLRTLKDQARQRRPMPGSTAALTEKQSASFSREHVFVTTANTPLRNNLLRHFYSICRRAKIEGATKGGSLDIHALRVSFATLALEHGANPKAVQAILGHTTLGMTMAVYARATDRSKREAVGSLPFTSITAPSHVIPVQFERAARTISTDDTEAPSAKRLG